MIKLKNFLLSVVAVIGSGACCAQSPYDLTPEEFRNRLESDTTAILLDVRTPEEYSAGHLPGAVNIDFKNKEEFTSGVKALSPNHTYYVYCRSGRRSALACDEMMNYNLPVYNMSGGIEAWKSLGYPLAD